MDAVYAFLGQYLGWQFLVAVGFCTLTATALTVLKPERKEEIALWLMGALPEESWHKSFLSMFDGLFGENHFGYRCVKNSALLSTVTICVIWYALYQSGNIRVDMTGTSLVKAIVIGVAINIVADYISLLETRTLLSHMPKNAVLQLAVLILDATLTGVIILGTIWVAAKTGLVPEDRSDPLAVMLAFSIYSAPFYSTFITSIWSWVYILGTWILRAFTRLRLNRLLDVENKPVIMLSLSISVFVYLGTLGVSAALEKDPNTGLSTLDSFVCETFKGEICLHMIGVTEAEETQFLLQTLACEGGFDVQACLSQGIKIYEITPERAAVLWRATCASGNAIGCTNLGFLYETGLGVDPDAGQAARLYRQGCDGGHALGCTNLGYLYQTGLGVEPDATRATSLYEHACTLDDATGCYYFGRHLRDGNDVDPDRAKAFVALRKACELGWQDACDAAVALVAD